MNFEIFFDACRNIYGKSSSTFWGIFIKIPKLIPRVATVVHMLPDMNLMTDLDLGGKIVQETGVSFNIIILEMFTIKGQS